MASIVDEKTGTTGRFRKAIKGFRQEKRKALNRFARYLYPRNPVLATGIMYRLKTGKFLNLRHPGTYNEKLQWFKLFGDESLMIRCGDKYTVRSYIEECGCPEILIPLHGVFGTPDDIDFKVLPERFVLKVTNGCGYNIVCRNSERDERETRALLAKWFSTDYGLKLIEPHYRKMTPRIICEHFLEDRSTGDVNDYKIHCLNGIPVYIAAFTGRQTGRLKVIRFGLDGNPIPLPGEAAPSETLLSMIPDSGTLEKMIRYAGCLSRDIPMVRIDFYIVNKAIFFGEMTFTPGAGFTAEVDRMFELPQLRDYLAAVKIPGRRRKSR